MKLTKRDVQKRVLKDGKPLDVKLFEWNIRTRTFESKVDGLVIDFKDIDNVHFNTINYCIFSTGAGCSFTTGVGCVFDTWYDCTFDTGRECMFTTGGGCTFTTGDNCTFKTGSECTFKTGNNCMFKTSYVCDFTTGVGCVFDTGNDCTFNTPGYCTFIAYHGCVFVTGHNSTIINKQHSEVIKPKNGVKLTICPLYTPGYLIGSDYYVNGVKQDGEYMLVDGILSKFISKKGNIFKVNNYSVITNSFNNKITYIVQDGDLYSHGDTIKEARESFIYKISNRDTSVYNNLTLNSVLTKEEVIKMYRVITGVCEYVVRKLMKSLTKIKDSYTVQEIVELTKYEYGNYTLRKFFKI